MIHILIFNIIAANAATQRRGSSFSETIEAIERRINELQLRIVGLASPESAKEVTELVRELGR